MTVKGIMRIQNFYKSPDLFEIDLSKAITNAKTAWEINFCNDLHKRYIKYGEDIFLTENSVNKIKELQVPYEDRLVI